ncbi:hypothetical protein BWR59_02830 [Pseudomonas sp. Bc-h]|uniref:pyrimidine/purine nucleoside phosphorylase n=1 Tax=Pseudomonas sp. Bc-h TaxID=1943632 RepID=UPI0009DB642D|nr:pyrimidine/purine nucleoside phosphorylase [Pseudomonas sp. Bc-h]OQR36625.1 hypothetical protein BWR59_02830 [Pseudomonas sp. Bc-h]
MFKLNDYFDGRVKSIGFEPIGKEATVGVMAPGQYTFSARRKEIMHVVEGLIKTRPVGAPAWNTFSSGQQFTVPAGTDFEVVIQQDTAYLCEYL